MSADRTEGRIGKQMEILKQWKTSEIIDFLNSYNRTTASDEKKALYADLYKSAVTELSERGYDLISLLY